MSVRAKFQVSRIVEGTITVAKYDDEGKYQGNEVKAVKTIDFFPVYSDGDPENKKFFASTPAGRIELSTVNAEAAAQFEQGKFYYVDFTEAE